MCCLIDLHFDDEICEGHTSFSLVTKYHRNLFVVNNTKAFLKFVKNNEKIEGKLTVLQAFIDTLRDINNNIM